MKAVLIPSPNGFSQQVILFQPKTVPTNMHLYDAGSSYYPSPAVNLMNGKNQSEETLCVCDFVRIERHQVLHREPLEQLAHTHGWYFDRIKQKAVENNFVLTMTFVYEIVKYNLHCYFPDHPYSLKRAIKENTIDPSWYEKHMKILELQKFTLKYFERMLGEDNAIRIWNWSIQGEGIFPREVQKKIVEWKRNREELDE